MKSKSSTGELTLFCGISEELCGILLSVLGNYHANSGGCMNMKFYGIGIACTLMVCMQGVNAVDRPIKKSFFGLAASYCLAKAVVHGYMTQFYFKQSLVPGLYENAKKEYRHVIQPPEQFRAWATTPWGKAVEHTSYAWHGFSSALWLCAGAGLLCCMYSC